MTNRLASALCATLLACGSSGPATTTPDAPRAAIDAAVQIQPDAAPASLHATPPVQDFGNVVQGSTVSATVQIMNGGGTTTGALGVAVTGADAADFAPQLGGCAGQSLAPAGSCSISLRFSPDSPGTKRASLVITAGGGLVVTVDLIGTSLVVGALMLTPSETSLDPVTVGSSATATFTVTNTGGTTTGTIDLVLGGTSKAELALASDSCTGKTLGSGLSCTVQVKLTPTVAGAKVGSLTAMATPGGGTAASVAGTGQAAVALTVAGTGGGTVTSNPAGLSCDRACGSATATFSSSPVTLVATPTFGSVFGGFTGCDTEPTATSCTVALDAASTPVVATFTGVPDAGVPDAPIVPDARPPSDAPPPDAPIALTIRPWIDATASFRFIDAERLGIDVYGKLCIFGDDFDPRPYAVFTNASHDPSEASWTIDATYGKVPAGIALRVAYYNGSVGAATPDGCVLSDSIALRGGQSLTKDAFYTATLTRAPGSQVCEVSDTESCEYVPPIADTTAPTGACASEGIFVLRDDSYPGTFRVVNLTQNAASIGTSTSEGAWSQWRNLDRVGETQENTSEPTAESSTLRICPSYLEGCYGSDVIDGGTALDDNNLCTSGDAHWVIQELDEPRLTMGTLKTTIYIIGLAPPPAKDLMSLDFEANPNGTEIIVAHDLSE